MIMKHKITLLLIALSTIYLTSLHGMDRDHAALQGMQPNTNSNNAAIEGMNEARKRTPVDDDANAITVLESMLATVARQVACLTACKSMLEIVKVYVTAKPNPELRYTLSERGTQFASPREAIKTTIQSIKESLIQYVNDKGWKHLAENRHAFDIKDISVLREELKDYVHQEDFEQLYALYEFETRLFPLHRMYDEAKAFFVKINNNFPELTKEWSIEQKNDFATGMKSIEAIDKIISAIIPTIDEHWQRMLAQHQTQQIDSMVFSLININGLIDVLETYITRAEKRHTELAGALKERRKKAAPYLTYLENGIEHVQKPASINSSSSSNNININLSTNKRSQHQRQKIEGSKPVQKFEQNNNRTSSNNNNVNKSANKHPLQQSSSSEPWKYGPRIINSEYLHTFSRTNGTGRGGGIPSTFRKKMCDHMVPVVVDTFMKQFAFKAPWNNESTCWVAFVDYSPKKNYIRNSFFSASVHNLANFCWHRCVTKNFHLNETNEAKMETENAKAFYALLNATMKQAASTFKKEMPIKTNPNLSGLDPFTNTTVTVVEGPHSILFMYNNNRSSITLYKLPAETKKALEDLCTEKLNSQNENQK